MSLSQDSRRGSSPVRSATPGSAGRQLPLLILAAFAAISLVGLWIAPRSIAWGFVPFLAVAVGAPGYALSRRLGVGGGSLVDVLVGLPLGLGVQFPVFAVAATFHLTASVFGTAALVVGLVVYLWAGRDPVEAAAWPSAGNWLRLYLWGIGLVALAAVWFAGRDSDDWAYGAFVADASENYPLSAFDPALGEDIPAFPRQRLNLWLGLLGAGARITSGSVPTMLQDSLPIVIGIVAMFATYFLGVVLGKTPKWGAVALTIQLAWFAGTVMHSQPGHAFLNRVGEDKFLATLVLFPVILGAIVLALRRGLSMIRFGVIGLLSGFGLAGIHPVNHFLLLAGLGIWVVAMVVTRTPGFRKLAVHVVMFSLAIVVALVASLQMGSIGPAPGSEDALALEAQMLQAEQPFGNSRIILNSDGEPILVHPQVVSQSLTLVMVALALALLVVRRSPSTLMVASLVLTVILFAFNPLAVPLVVDTLGVNMLWRFTWLLPVPFVIPAYAAAFRGNGVEIPSGAVFVILIVAAMQLPTLQASYTTYEKGRSAWRATAALEQVYDVLSAEAQRHDVALATGIPSLQLPAHVPKVSQLAYRGPLGTRWHFPRERVDEGVARELAVQAFYTNIGRDFNQSDYDTLTDYDVAYIILAVDDPRFSQVSDIRGLELLFSNLEWALVSVDVDSLKWFEFI